MPTVIRATTIIGAPQGNEDIRDQHTDNSQWNNSVNGRVSWTEPLGNIKNVRFIDISYSSSYPLEQFRQDGL
jgi:hypothetical protein